MINPKSPYNRRENGSREPPRTPNHYSATSTTSYASSTTSNKSTSAVNSFTRKVLEAFAGCFTPPNDNHSHKSSSYFDDSSLYKASSDASNSSNSGQKHGQQHYVYASSNTSRHSQDIGRAKLTMADIYKATKKFSPNLKVGQGGFGTVYKGQLRDGTIVAIKRAKKDINDKHSGQEFRSEVQTLAQVEHLNLVRLYGYVEEEDERILIVEYVPNGTLREHLDGLHSDVHLDLSSRIDIAIDVAHAITYLHTYADHPIIHRDIKSSNILLTEKLRAKVADFGFARLGADVESGATHVSTQVKGTAGYLDPEYLSTYHLTDKSDVYSFGVLLVELVTGRRPVETKRPISERVTAKWAIKKFSQGDAMLAMDPRVERSAANYLALEKIFELASQCLAPHRQIRPSMKKCAEVLWGIRKDYTGGAVSDTSTLSHKPRRDILIREE